ncbi:MAG: NTP/NDP exchange transporter [Gammaproteobacteria bacterium]
MHNNNLRLSISSLIRRLVDLETQETAPVVWAFAYFFCLLCGYYIIRPIRDEMAILGGVENLQWLFTGTLLAMLLVVPVFGWLSSRYQRRQFLPWVYGFFVFNLLLFSVLLKLPSIQIYVARAFFIWVSVFNLFVVSVFWSLMADIFNNNQAKRLFGFIAAGGTAGAITGPGLTALLVEQFGKANLLLLSALFLSLTIIAIVQLCRWSDETLEQTPAPLGGGILDGIKMVIASPYLSGICLLIFFYTTLSTFLYFQQAQIFADNITDSNLRIKIFSYMEIAVNVLTLSIQFFFTGRIIKRLGLALALIIVPLLLVFGFIALGIAAGLGTIIAVQIIKRSGNYAIMRPAREMLFVVLDKDAKYKAKNFIDTTIYRTGDAFSAWVYAALKGAGLSLNHIAFIAVPVTAAWVWLSYRLGKQQQGKAALTTTGEMT